MSRLSDTLAPLRQRWQALAPRERGLLGGAALLVLVAALWLGPGRWAWKTLRTGPALEAQARQQLQDMQGLAQRIRPQEALKPPRFPPSSGSVRWRLHAALCRPN